MHLLFYINVLNNIPSEVFTYHIHSQLTLFKSVAGYDRASQVAHRVAQLVKNLPTMQEILVRPLDWEDPLEEGMATHSSIFAWRIPMDRGAWQAMVHGVAKSQTRLRD